MPGYLSNTISALVYDLCSLYGGSQYDTWPANNDVVRFVSAQMDRMPAFLALQSARLPWHLAQPAAARRLAFSPAGSERRRVQVDAWRRSKLGPCQDLMKFYSSLVVLAMYSRPQAPPPGLAAMSERYRAEAVIVGSGPGGAVTAWTLAAAGKDVILLEEGPHLDLSSCAAVQHRRDVSKIPRRRSHGCDGSSEDSPGRRAVAWAAAAKSTAACITARRRRCWKRGARNSRGRSG